MGEKEEVTARDAWQVSNLYSVATNSLTEF